LYITNNNPEFPYHFYSHYYTDSLTIIQKCLCINLVVATESKKGVSLDYNTNDTATEASKEESFLMKQIGTIFTKETTDA
jgi:hypothetical protein